MIKEKHKEHVNLTESFFFVCEISVISGESTTIRSPIHGLSSYNNYVIVYDESSQKHFEKIQNFIVEVGPNYR